MEKFIRIDVKGEWRGSEHLSGWNEETGELHEGASCYSLEDIVDGIANLWEYWTEYASTYYDPSDFEDKQVTIFEGEKVGDGPDAEALAVSKKTIREIDAVPFMNKLMNLIDQHEFDEITDDEYKAELEKLVQG